MLFSFEGTTSRKRSGDDSKEETPVPMPNTEVKVFSVDDTWWETARESRTLPEQNPSYTHTRILVYSSLAQSVGRTSDCTWGKTI